jgi:hypothetical protein
MLHVGIAFQVAVNFLLMVEVVGQRRVKLRLREVRQALQNLIRRHAQLVITGNRAHRDARALDDRHTTQDSRTGRNVRIFDAVCLHRIKLTAISRASKPANFKSQIFSINSLKQILMDKPFGVGQNFEYVPVSIHLVQKVARNSVNFRQSNLYPDHHRKT